MIPFFTDADVADSVGNAILAGGHSLIRLRDVMLGDSPDPVVAAACREAGRVLVTHNYRDFRALSKKLLLTKRQLDTLDRIELLCSQVVAARRVEDELELIEFEYARRRSGAGMRIQIQQHGFRVSRDELGRGK